MSEGIFESYDPFAYKVNNVSGLDKGLVKAFKAKDKEKIEEIINDGSPLTADVFITINHHQHACILIVPTSNDLEFEHIQLVSENPFSVPANLMCWLIDLRFEEIYLRTYKISMKMELLEVLKKSIKKAFFIARYENVGSNLCFQLAILRAAPNRYNAILADCVEFAKEFCICLLSYCSNFSDLEAVVKENIKSATATGLSVEHLSRNSGMCAYLGNLILGGTDISSILSGNSLFVVAAVIFFFVYPVAISLLVFYIFPNHISK